MGKKYVDNRYTPNKFGVCKKSSPSRNRSLRVSEFYDRVEKFIYSEFCNLAYLCEYLSKNSKSKILSENNMFRMLSLLEVDEFKSDKFDSKLLVSNILFDKYIKMESDFEVFKNGFIDCINNSYKECFDDLRSRDLEKFDKVARESFEKVIYNINTLYKRCYSSKTKFLNDLIKQSNFRSFYLENIEDDVFFGLKEYLTDSDRLDSKFCPSWLSKEDFDLINSFK